MYTEQKAQLDYELTDYGKLLFEYNSLEKKLPLYVSSEKRKANLKSPLFYYVISIPIVMICWFIASLISAASLSGDALYLRLGLTLGSLLPMALCCFIVIKIAFGFWGNLYQWKLRGSYNKKEEYLRVYKDYVVVKKDDVTSVYDMTKIVSVELHWCYYIMFRFQNTSQVFFIEIPPSPISAERLARIFGEKLTVAASKRFAEPVDLDSKSVGELIIGTLFALFAMGVGVAVICIRVHLGVDVPVFLGIMFIGGGLMLACGILSFIPFVKDIITPFMAGAFFIVMPWGLVSTLHGEWGLGEGFKVFTVFSPFSCFAVVLSSVSVLFIANGVIAIMDYIRYGHKLGKM
ncbi:MAG: hypothetical protein K2O35_01630 [Clostridia bacterium]|nr:hypothetical protein [Clostridia bacterium]